MELPYDGEEGRTRRATVHVPLPQGGTRTLSIVCAVNVHTDPGLRAAALEGTLHHTEVGELAVPFVYHDPEERRFALVVPETLAHRALHERADLLKRLADAERELPAYVAEATVVLGAEGLRAHLGRQPEAKRAAELGAREERLSRREAQLGSEGDRLEALLGELEERERELEARLEALGAREADLLAESVESLEMDGEPTSARRDEPLAEAVELVDDPLERTDTRESVGAFDDASRVPASGAIRVGAFQDEVTDGELVELDDDEVEELQPVATSVLDDDDVELLDEDELPEPTELRVDDGPSHLEKRIPTPATPPPGFFEDRSTQMMASMADGPWLFVRLDEGQEEAFRGEVELLAQYIAIEGTPVVLLALVEWQEPRSYTRRAALDPQREDHRAILDALRDGAEATAAVFGPEARFERSMPVGLGPRRANLASILQRADRAAAESEGGDVGVAMERALAAPPPLSLRGHPFHDAPPAADAKEARDALMSLAKWSKPAKLDMALLALSIPRDVVDDAFRRILDDALRHGLAIQGPLVSRAVSLGVVAEPGEMVERLVDAFRGTARLEGSGGLDAQSVAANWEGLLALSEEYEVAIETEAHEQAHSDIAAARGSARAKAVEESEIPGLDTKALVALVEHPKLRRPVALELLSRAGPSDSDLVARVVRAVRKMPREEVLDVMPRVFPLGEAAADALIDTLSARKTFVRQAAALCLGELQMRRAVRPLVQLLVEEPTQVWQEVARVLSSSGSSLARALRRVTDVDGAHERIAYLLAHTRLGGDGELVDTLAEDGDEALRRMALDAAEHQEVARAHREQVTGESSSSEDDPVREFSRRFLTQVASAAE